MAEGRRVLVRVRAGVRVGVNMGDVERDCAIVRDLSETHRDQRT